jgi:hypothetical protein
MALQDIFHLTRNLKFDFRQKVKINYFFCCIKQTGFLNKPDLNFTF